MSRRPPKCALCLLAVHEATKEHLTPRSRGGSNGPDNVRTACRLCNEAKADMTFPEYRYFQRTGRFRGSYIRWLERKQARMERRARTRTTT